MADAQAQLADAEERRLDAEERAEAAEDHAGGLARELGQARARVRELEGQLRAERHEHAESRARRAIPVKGCDRTVYAVLAVGFFAGRFAVDNPITQIGFAVAAFLLAVAFVLSPRSPR